MIEKEKWLKEFVEQVKEAFGIRITFIGIQGSYARGEATEKSDIDVVVILDKFSYEDVRHYDCAISGLPDRDKICGFISGKQELRNWDRADLFQLYYDTAPLYGNLGWMKELIRLEDVWRACHLGACNIYHMCVHNAIHEKSPDILRSLYKSAMFVQPGR